MSKILDFISELDAKSFLSALIDSSFYRYLFPFLLVFTVLNAILPNALIFKNKKTGKPYKAVVFTISLIVALFSVSFEISDAGYVLGDFICMMFPNISALTIAILCLYFVGAIIGENFFKGALSPRYTSFLTIFILFIGFGSFIYYMGIVMGFWDDYVISNLFFWNITIAIIFTVLGLLFLFIDMALYGLLLLVIVGGFIANYGDNVSILSYFVDPIIFIAFLFVAFFTYLTQNDDDLETQKDRIRKKMDDISKEMESIKKSNSGKEPKDYEHKIYDILKASYYDYEKKLKKLEK